MCIWGTYPCVLEASCQRSCKCPFDDCLFVLISRCHAATPCSAWHAPKLHPALSPYMDPSIRVMRLASGRSQPCMPQGIESDPCQNLTQQSASRVAWHSLQHCTLQPPSERNVSSCRSLGPETWVQCVGGCTSEPLVSRLEAGSLEGREALPAARSPSRSLAHGATAPAQIFALPLFSAPSARRQVAGPWPGQGHDVVVGMRWPWQQMLHKSTTATSVSATSASATDAPRCRDTQTPKAAKHPCTKATLASAYSKQGGIPGCTLQNSVGSVPTHWKPTLEADTGSRHWKPSPHAGHTCVVLRRGHTFTGP